MSIVREVIKSFFSKPSTIEYPRKASIAVEKDLRGRHYANLNKCIGCSICAIECPSKAIEMKKLSEDIKLKHNPRGLYPVINYMSCVFCYRCVRVCPVDAYITTPVHQLSSVKEVFSENLTLKTLEVK
ncbi:MAG: 4Fe-4S binding protein [Ignisphaera sp.]|uniref:4Fe-4S dicluster domain-containing protein n=1 Tax=Ignisphaera aggregans TaxID=334771 RepID=A0A7J3MYX3_9CREN